MTEPLPDTWYARDLPVLRVVVRLYDETMRPVRINVVEEETGLSRQDVQRAGIALVSGGLVTTSGASQMKVLMFGGVTAEARRLAGSWPSPETAADRIVEALEQIAENTDNEDTRTRARKILDGFAGSGRQIAVGVGTAVINGQIG